MQAVLLGLIAAIDRNTAAIDALTEAVQAAGVETGGAARGSEPIGTPVAVDQNRKAARESEPIGTPVAFDQDPDPDPESDQRKTLQRSFSDQIKNPNQNPESDQRKTSEGSFSDRIKNPNQNPESDQRKTFERSFSDRIKNQNQIDWDLIVNKASLMVRQVASWKNEPGAQEDFRTLLRIVALCLPDPDLRDCCRRVLPRFPRIPAAKRIGYLMVAVWREMAKQSGRPEAECRRELRAAIAQLQVPVWGLTELRADEQTRRTLRVDRYAAAHGSSVSEALRSCAMKVKVS